MKPHHCEVPKDLKLEVTRLLSSSQKVNNPIVGWKTFRLAFACLVIGKRGSVIGNLWLQTMPPHLCYPFICTCFSGGVIYANSHFNDLTFDE
ncbi:hypothetical protein EUGRSUZ_C04234 [Eucalyptus grandis]|uniref:Uncharacterized protein n=2 Tax=Eucalyptus grandis TaxID=71139 RepID=A0ACC3LK06_EUCGR|nr:hypothetical protein EUGRSUZ_C04234 [Eucalyptus grandis]